MLPHLAPRGSFASLLVFAAVIAAAVGIVAARLTTYDSLTDSAPQLLQDQGAAPVAAAVDQGDPDVVFPEHLAQLPAPPSHIAVDSLGTVWFPLWDNADSGTPSLYRYDPATGEAKVFPLPGSGGSALFSGMGISPEGTVIVGYGDLVVEFNPTDSSVIQYVLPTPPANESKQALEDGTWVTNLDIGADGTVFVGRMNTAAVTVVDRKAKKVSEVAIPATFGPIHRIAAAKDGVYVSNGFGAPGVGRQLGLISSGGEFLEIPGAADLLTLGPSGTVYAAGIDGRLNVLAKGQMVEAGGEEVTSQMKAAAHYLAFDERSSRLWFAGEGVGTVGWLDTVTASSRFYQLPVYRNVLRSCLPDVPCPPADAQTLIGGMDVAPDGSLYFSDSSANRIGLIKTN